MAVEDGTDNVEALTWLEQADGKDRTMGQDSDTCLSTQNALKLVRELYAAGATQVVARVVTAEYEFEEASGLTVMLPQDRSKRMALFTIGARVLREMGSTLAADEDRGQDAFSLGW